MKLSQVTEHIFEDAEHTTFYLASGPVDGPLVIFIHGWPELSLSWRHQLPVLGGLGFRCIAPDMRGYGRSTVFKHHEDYALERSVADMSALLRHLGREKAVWVGHDWGSPVAWSLASHHPELTNAVASLCVPYRTLDVGLDETLKLANRDMYPTESFPAAQWEYMRFYEQNFAKATEAFDANPYNTMKMLFRKGDPEVFGEPAGTAFTRINNGWFGEESQAPDIPIDADVVSEEDLKTYVHYLEENSFFGPDSWYMNHTRNAEYGKCAVNDGQLDVPVLFLAAQYDYVCDAINSDLARPMRENCVKLTEHVVYSGHWMAQEKPIDVNRHLSKWLLDLGTAN